MDPLNEIEGRAPSRVDLQAGTKPHRCLTVPEICQLRRESELPLASWLRILSKLEAHCPACWKAMEDAREVPKGDMAPTTSPEVRFLRTLTVDSAICTLYPRHRQAALEARNAPFGSLRLYSHEVLIATKGQPAASRDELEAVVALLGDIPQEHHARLAWYNLHAELESHIAMAWAQQHQPERATAALERAALHLTAGEGQAEGAANLLLSRAQCALCRQAEVEEWLPFFEEALGWLDTEAHQAQRVEVLNDVGVLLGEAKRFHEAHGHLLAGLRIAGKPGVAYPVLNLGLLHNLGNIEMMMVLDDQNDPLAFALFITLTTSHMEQAAGLYEEWGTQALCQDAEILSCLLSFLAKRWATLDGLRAEWHLLLASGKDLALPGVRLLGLATVGGHGQFVVLHAAEVRRAVAASSKARTRLRGFEQELQRLWPCLEEMSQQKVLAPWLELVAQMMEVGGDTSSSAASPLEGAP